MSRERLSTRERRKVLDGESMRDSIIQDDHRICGEYCRQCYSLHDAGSRRMGSE